MTTTDDALTVARFCWPDDAFDFEHRVNLLFRAERILVERGLGEGYAMALLGPLGLRCTLVGDGTLRMTLEAIVAIRTAPLDVCLRAMAAAIREHEAKEGRT